MCIAYLNAQTTYPKGQVIDSIAISEYIEESYSLYLPNDYNPNVLSSIVFIFDPSGNGKYGIQPFILAAEKYNYILVCSNDSKNGPYQKNFDIANRLFSSVFKNFNIDPKQIYVAGFSGGSRFSTAIAVLTEQMQAVIACGSGFPDNIDYAPVAPVFSYAGIVGDRDMNYNEMRNNRIFLNKLNFTNSLFVFDGNHQWPPPETILETFDWLQIIAFKKGIREEKEKDIDSIYQQMYDKAMHSEDVIHKEAIMNRIKESFGTFKDVDSISKKLMTLRKSKQFVNASTELKQIFEKEDKLIEKFIPRFYDDYKDPIKADLKWWKKELAKLKRLAKIDKAHSDMIDRFTYKLLELVYTRSNSNYFPVTREQQKFCYEILNDLKKKYNLIYIY